MNQIVKGKHAVKEALLAGQTIDKIVISLHIKHKKECVEIVELAKEHQAKIQWLPPKIMQQTYDDATKNQGIVAHILELSFYKLDTLLATPQHHPQIMILDHIQDPHNFGAILRSCECFGIKTVIFAKDRQAQINPTVSKTSAGALAHLNLIRVTNLQQTIKKLKDAGFWIYGTSLEGGQPLSQTAINNPCAMIIGNEHKGMSPTLKKLCDSLIYINMQGHIQSLNASVSAGIVCYELSQRKSST